MKEKINDAGALYDVDLLKHKSYLLTSLQGTYRGGKARSVQKQFIMLSGKAESITIAEDQEQAEMVTPGQIYIVPAHVPHLLYFLEDSEFFEWWDKDYSERKYQPFYDRKQK